MSKKGTTDHEAYRQRQLEFHVRCGIRGGCSDREIIGAVRRVCGFSVAESLPAVIAAQRADIATESDAQRFADLFDGEGEAVHAQREGEFTFKDGAIEVIAKDETVWDALDRTTENGGAPKDPLLCEVLRWVFADGSVIVTDASFTREFEWYFEGSVPWSRHAGT